MKRAGIVMAAIMTVILVAGSAVAATATYADFTANVIRNGTSGSYTTSATSSNIAQDFTITAVGGGKVAIATSVANGKKVSDFVSFGLSNSVNVTAGSGIVYPNMWVTDGAGHYGLLSFDVCSGTGGQDDQAVYNQMVSSGGMDKAYFDSLAVRVYSANTTDLSWLYSGAVEKSKFGGWAQSLWMSSGATTVDPVLVSDLNSNLEFGSPFTSNTIPGIVGNPQYTYAGTGDPQMTSSFFLMCGDTSGSVQNQDYTLSNLQLVVGSEAVPEPVSMIFFATGLVAVGGFMARRRMLLRKA